MFESWRFPDHDKLGKVRAGLSWMHMYLEHKSVALSALCYEQHQQQYQKQQKRLQYWHFTSCL